LVKISPTGHEPSLTRISLGPILFIIFINYLPEVVTNVFKIYADDSKIIANVQTPESRIQLQKDIDNFTKWCETWCMELNGRKCKVIHFGNSQVVRDVERSYSVTFKGETSELAISEWLWTELRTLNVALHMF
jgi:hypothetical protein